MFTLILLWLIFGGTSLSLLGAFLAWIGLANSYTESEHVGCGTLFISLIILILLFL